MSQVDGFVFLVKRQGEGGKIGPLKNVLQLAEGSPIIEQYLKHRSYYIGSKEEYEEFLAEHQNPGAVAGDVDGDSDSDAADREVAQEAVAKSASVEEPPSEPVEELVQ